MTSPSPAPIRLVVVLAGGAALGAYEAGAVAGLLTGLRSLREQGVDARLDVITGASAGSIVAYLGAVVAVTGRDPVAALRQAWVRDVDTDLLRADRSRFTPVLRAEDVAPLTFDALPASIDRLWDEHPAGEPLQGTPVVLHVSITDLAGHAEPVDGPRGPGTIQAPTFVRDERHVLPAGLDVANLDPDVLDAVLASASHPGGFVPRLLEGRWSVDGAMVESRPLRRALASLEALDDEPVGDGPPPRTVVLVIDPRSEDPAGARRWVDGDDPPGWLEGLGRSLAMLGTQAIYDDVRDLLSQPVVELAGERDGEAADRVAGAAPDGTVVDVICPSILQDAEVGKLLAGEFLGDFGGFLSEDLRHSDFVLGYASLLTWGEVAMPALGITAEQTRVALETVRDAHAHDWRETNRGEARLAALDEAARWAAVRLAASALAAVGRTALSPPLDAALRMVDQARDRVADVLGREGH